MFIVHPSLFNPSKIKPLGSNLWLSTGFYKDLLWHFFTLKLGSQPLSNSSASLFEVWTKSGWEESMGIYALNIDFLCGLIQPRPRNIQRHLHTIWPKALCGWSMSQNGPEGGNIMIWTRIFHDSSTTLTFDLETLFKVTAHFLPKDTLKAR